jgi:hypothetical protein
MRATWVGGLILFVPWCLGFVVGRCTSSRRRTDKLLLEAAREALVERGAALDVRERQVFEWEQWVRAEARRVERAWESGTDAFRGKCAEEPRHREAPMDPE